MRKILVIITTAFVPYGGLASVMMNLYRGIDHSRFQIDFASTNASLDRNLAAELELNNSHYYSLGSRKKGLFTYIMRLSSLLKENSYDVIHVHSNSATAAIELALAKKYHIPKRIVHNHTSICDHKTLHALLNPFFQGLYTDAVACSQKAGEWIFPDGHYRILQNGINTERYRFSRQAREEIRGQYGIPDSAFVMGHVGKIYKPKNHRFLVEVFDDYHRTMPNSVLLLVGDGVMRGEIEADVKRRGLQDSVIFSGMQSAPERFLSAMDVFVFPSVWEGMPLSLIEAQASGLPCLISDTIDEGAIITDRVQRLGIAGGTSQWIQELEAMTTAHREAGSDESIKKIKACGFDSKYNAQKLEELYLGNV